MAEIPSGIASSAAQAGFLARDVANAREASRTAQANAAGKQANTIDDVGDVVETDDADARVSTESEGAGSQGRSPEEEEPSDAAEDTSQGITCDDDGQLHLDLEA